MRTLVVGAGVAGLSLAARLCQQGRPPVIVERDTASSVGYAIGLYPLGSCVFHGLGTYPQLVERSATVTRYELASGTGQVLQALDMSVLTGSVGPMLMIDRADLVDLLESSCTTAEIRRGVTVTAVVQRDDGVDVTFTDGSTAGFDAVIGCDGMGSALRDLCFEPATGFDAGWVLWTWWAPTDRFAPDVVREWWGEGCFFGAYPAPGRVMCAAGGPAEMSTDGDPGAAIRGAVGSLSMCVPAVRGAIEHADGAFRWPMRDTGAGKWVAGRVALCGDAAAGFLPTAGVGASNALRAAAGLADEVSRADEATVPLALALYEKRCRSVVEGNQTDSRRLARVMFVRNPGLVWARDQIARRYPAKRMLGQIIDSMREPF